MLKTEGMWEALTPNERLLLLAVAFKVPTVCKLRVPHADAKANSGFSDEDYEATLNQLYMKGLVTKSNSGVILTGDANSEGLLGEKSEEALMRREATAQEQLALITS